jgi:predicted CXXCH cytochrome family protein
VPSSIDESDYVLKTTPTNEDSDWEYTKSATDHNYYKGVQVKYTSGDEDKSALKTYQSISAFCAGCHPIFHNTSEISSYSLGVPYKSPWLRHPTDIQLPDSSEYSGYDPVDSYSAEAPVAWTNPASPTRETAVVMCLSCHRPHGSNQPDMLRWDYGTMIAGGGGSGGCFTCHTTKN